MIELPVRGSPQSSMNWRVFFLFLLAIPIGLFSPVYGQSPTDILQDHDPNQDVVQDAVKTSPDSPLVSQAQAPTEPDKKIENIFGTIENIIETLIKIFQGLNVDINIAGKPKEKPEEKASPQSSKYSVKSGESLWKIAQQLLGDGERYMEIVEANKAKYPSLANNPNLIYPGWELTIPGGSGGGQEDKPGKKPSTESGGDQNAGTGAPSDVSKKIAEVAATFPNRYGPREFPYAAGTEGGNLGCANVVSQALKEAGVGAWSLSVQGVKSKLLGAPNNWKIARPPPYMPGDVVIWSPPPGGIHGHIGIVAKNGNSLMAMNNSSGQRKPVWSSIEYRRIECIVRKA